MYRQYVKNIITLGSGNALAQLIALFSMPILTRLYPPHDYGIWGSLLAIVMIFLPVLSAKYELSIIQTKAKKSAFLAFVLALFIMILISSVIAVGLYFYTYFVQTNDYIVDFLWVVPIILVLMGLYNIFTQYFLKFQLYQELKQITINRSLFLNLSQIILGYLHIGVFGLIIGNILGFLIANILFFYFTLKKKIFNVSYSLHKIGLLFRKNFELAKYNVGSNLITSLTQNATILMITILFSVTYTGYYLLVVRILELPMIFIGNTIGQVFYNSATEEKKNQKESSVKIRVHPCPIPGRPMGHGDHGEGT